MQSDREKKYFIVVPCTFILTMMGVAYVISRSPHLMYMVPIFGLLVGIEVFFTAFVDYKDQVINGTLKDYNFLGHSTLWYAALYSMAPVWYYLTEVRWAWGPWRYGVNPIGFMFFEGAGNWLVMKLTGTHPSYEAYHSSRWSIGRGAYTRWDYLLYAWVSAGFIFSGIFNFMY